jgi:HEAT repeat protein
LISALRHEDPGTRVSAAERLGRLGSERAVDALLNALRDPEPAVRAMAIWSLDETNPTR